MVGSERGSDRQTRINILTTGGVALATIGGVLMTVGATTNDGSRHTVWINPLFVVGWALAVGGALVVLWALVSALRSRAKTIYEPVDIFNFASSTLETGRPWEMVCIYAPVGLWDKSDSDVPDAKTRWLRRLAKAVGKEGDDSPDVGGFKGVFGLPQERSLYEDYAKEKLEIFLETQHSELRHFPPEAELHPMAAPGIGIIVFENRLENRYQLIFAFVGKTPGEEVKVVRSGFRLDDKEIGQLVADWFDEQVWMKTEYFGLKGPALDRKTNRKIVVDLSSALRCIEQEYYS
jgi:hypothetical protein